jgi:hypothetical protein
MGSCDLTRKSNRLGSRLFTEIAVNILYVCTVVTKLTNHAAANYELQVFGDLNVC